MQLWVKMGDFFERQNKEKLEFVVFYFCFINQVIIFGFNFSGDMSYKFQKKLIREVLDLRMLGIEEGGVEMLN